jgi:peptide/nickel transport system substrate-binding protein
LGALLAVTMIVGIAACGDDDDGGAGATAPPGATSGGAPATGATSGAGTATSATAGGAATDATPVSGGKAEILVPNEIASLDPVKANPSSAADGQRDFAIYGALVVADVATGEVQPVLAESFAPDSTFQDWTLKLRPGLVFSDGSPFDAAAVKVNWDRIADPANASSSRSAAASIAASTVVDPTTLDVRLAAPNSTFDRLVGRSALDYVASATAIASGHDLTSDPVGAGPFVLQQWLRDDHITMVRNPHWYDAPRPYLDQLTFRVVIDEQQRVDTFTTGGADGYYAPTANSGHLGTEQGGVYTGVDVGHAGVMAFNVTAPPFDDVRVRRAVAMAIDWQDMVQATDGDQAKAAATFAVEGTPWFAADATPPPYDVAQAQRLLDAYRAEKGLDTLKLEIFHSQSARYVDFAEFAQTALSQLKGIDVSEESADQATLIQRMFQHDFQIGFWGYPTLYPDPDLEQAVYTGLSTNVMGYSNPVVDQAFDQARTTGDAAARAQLYAKVYEQLATDLPFRPISHEPKGFVVRKDVHVGGLYQDGILRSDLTWREQ